ncbi:hypothetical protein ABBQ32_006928 [Trebouxia sp. C0010 RCD-2024]
MRSMAKLSAVAMLVLAGFSYQSHAEIRPSQPSRKLLQTCSTPPWGQCGGQSCPGGVDCHDAAYACCPSGFGCSRSSAYYWQCLPNAPVVAVPSPSSTPAATPPRTPSPTLAAPVPVPVITTSPVPTPSSTPSNRLCPTTISAFAQCGGRSSCGSGVNCNDALWYSSGCCADGFTCSRGNEYFWQCVPGTPSNTPSSSPPPPPPAATASPAPTTPTTTSPAGELTNLFLKCVLLTPPHHPCAPFSRHPIAVLDLPCCLFLSCHIHQGHQLACNFCAWWARWYNYTPLHVCQYCLICASITPATASAVLCLS